MVAGEQFKAGHLADVQAIGAVDFDGQRGFRDARAQSVTDGQDGRHLPRPVTYVPWQNLDRKATFLARSQLFNRPTQFTLFLAGGRFRFYQARARWQFIDDLQLRHGELANIGYDNDIWQWLPQRPGRRSVFGDGHGGGGQAS